MCHTPEPVTVYAVETLDGAERDSWVVDSLWTTRDKAEAYAKARFQQCNWGSPVPSWNIQPYTLDSETP